MSSVYCKISCLICFALLLPGNAVWSDEVICAHCGKPITDKQWIVVEGRNYHNNHFICAYCGEQIENRYYVDDSLLYHRDCYINNIAPRCGYCNRPIEDEYIVQDSVAYHDSCFKNHVALRCALCGEIITGDYYRDFWGNNIHADHKGKIPECEYCGRFISDNITGGGAKYGDGRIICNICMKSAVNDRQEAIDILPDIISILSGRGIRIETEILPLHLIDRTNMAELAEDLPTDPHGFVYFEQTDMMGGLIKKQEFKIYLLHGMPRPKFDATMAHELMHIWLLENAPHDIEPALCEGSCNYAAYLILERIPGKDAEYRISCMNQDPDEIYGEGFRRVREFVDKNGVARWLDYLKKNTKLPR